MKSESTHYQPTNTVDTNNPPRQITEQKMDLLESISTLQDIIDDNEAKMKSIKEQTAMAKSKLRKLQTIQKDYEKVISSVSESIIADEASGFNGEKV